MNIDVTDERLVIGLGMGPIKDAHVTPSQYRNLVNNGYHVIPHYKVQDVQLIFNKRKPVLFEGQSLKLDPVANAEDPKAAKQVATQEKIVPVVIPMPEKVNYGYKPGENALTDPELAYTIEYKSSNEYAATVDEDGLVTAADDIGKNSAYTLITVLVKQEKASTKVAGQAEGDEGEDGGDEEDPTPEPTPEPTDEVVASRTVLVNVVKPAAERTYKLSRKNVDDNPMFLGKLARFSENINLTGSMFAEFPAELPADIMGDPEAHPEIGLNIGNPSIVKTVKNPADGQYTFELTGVLGSTSLTFYVKDKPTVNVKFTVVACEDPAQSKKAYEYADNPANAHVKVTGLEVEPKTITVGTNQGQSFAVKILPENATNKHFKARLLPTKQNIQIGNTTNSTFFGTRAGESKLILTSDEKDDKGLPLAKAEIAVKVTDSFDQTANGSSSVPDNADAIGGNEETGKPASGPVQDPAPDDGEETGKPASGPVQDPAPDDGEETGK